MADSAYEITNTREQIAKVDKDLKKTDKEIRKDTATNRAKIDTLENTVASLKKAAGNKDKRNERLAQSRTTPNASNQDLGDLEDDLRLLRMDHDQLAEKVEKALPQM